LTEENSTQKQAFKTVKASSGVAVRTGRRAACRLAREIAFDEPLSA
jgi:hypothetical protein